MNRNILDFIRQRELICPGDHVICALSGGKDSMFMLHVLLELQDALGITLSAAHMNHNLRGEESLRDEQFVRTYCDSLGISLVVGSADVSGYAKANKLGLEEAARILRYEFLSGISPEAKIATAHTAEDNLETLLLHLVRGCGLQGLSGIPPRRGQIIRPLLMTSRREIEDHLQKNSIPHVEDSSNDSDLFLRNRIRHHILPAFMEENPNLPTLTSSLCLEVGEEYQYLSRLTEETLHNSLEDGRLPISVLLNVPRASRMRLLRSYLEPVPELSRSHLEAAEELCHNPSPSARLTLPGGYVLWREYDFVVLESTVSNEAIPSVTIGAGQTVNFGSWQISCHAAPCPEIPAKNTFSLIPPPSGVFELRCRQSGDRISLPGGTKKLSRYLVDQKIPAKMRDTLPVVISEGRLAAVLPLTADKNFRAEPGNDSFILTVERMEEVK